MIEPEPFFQDGDIPKSALLPSGYLSASQIKTYLRCQMQYFWRYVQGIIKPPKASMAEGSVLHRSVERALREKMTGQHVYLDLLKDTWRQTWTEKEKEVEDWEESDKTAYCQEAEKRGMKFLEMYHEHFLPSIQPKSVEQDFQVLVGPSKIPIIGFIDLVDGAGSGTVVDHKVVNMAKPEAEVKGDLQLTVYAKATGLTNVRFDCFVKTKSPKIVKLSATRDHRDQVWLDLLVERVVQGIHSGNFIPCAPGGWSCTEKQCGYFDICRK
jgi:RecB family exonuclease